MAGGRTNSKHTHLNFGEILNNHKQFMSESLQIFRDSINSRVDNFFAKFNVDATIFVLKIKGIPELPNETWDMTEQAVKKALSEKLEFSPSEVDSMNIERAHRVRDSRPGRQDRTSSEG